jgi:putative lipoic acid-binding regulatory protein
MESNAFYQSLQEKLAANMVFPSQYIFKFIVPNQPTQTAQVVDLFDNNTEINQKKSKNNTYISFTAKQWVQNTDEIIDIYKQAQSIKGIISL